VGANRRAWHEANESNERGRACADAGDWDDALPHYRHAIGLEPAFEPAWFNMGLIYKWRHEWTEALACNERAASLSEGGEGEPAWWNLAIAATALRRWDVARNAWRRFGIVVPDGDDEIQMPLGMAPVRLRPQDHGEVVWGLRIDPARIVIKNVPLPESGHRWGGIVLHDGAPNGQRTVGDRTYGVFDELERWQASGIPTLEVEMTVAGEPDCHALTDVFDHAGFAAQDWTASVRVICKLCSQGHPPANHEHPAEMHRNTRRFGLAAPVDPATRLLADWAAVQPELRHHGRPVAVG
jgi:hypothetical protein